MQHVLEALGSRAEVLYVEDNPVNVQLMLALFECRPHLNLAVAEDGHQALHLATRLKPSLLLLDLRLPDCHGAALLRQLRHFDGWADIPAVAVTAEFGFQAPGTGFCEVWAKPLNIAFVLERLDHLLVPPREARQRVATTAASGRAAASALAEAGPGWRHAQGHYGVS